MTGIVERLREAANDEKKYASEQDFWHEEILREAADTIESLREALEPFALASLAFGSEWPDDERMTLHTMRHPVVECVDVITPSDLRRAAAALSKLSEPQK
jgi:hypothetical protein